jgi:hypothetical protein
MPDAEIDEGDALGKCYRLARRRAQERRAALAEFSWTDILAELVERNQGKTFGHLADLLGQARTRALAATDPEQRYKHAALFWFLRGELERRAAL